jgi:hypothetical protein
LHFIGICGIFKKRMNREARDTRKLFLTLACCLMLCVSALAADTVITSLKTDCLVDQAGGCQVTQTVTVNFAANEKEADFPLGTGAKNGALAGYQTTAETDKDGFSYLKLANAGGFSGSRTFTLTYSLSGLVTKQEDGTQLLTLPLLPGKWAYPVSSYDFTVTMPAAFKTKPSFVSGYYGDVIGDYMTVTQTDALLSGSLKEALRDNETLTMLLNVGAGYFTSSRGAAWTGGGFILALSVIFVLLALVYWAFTLRSPNLHASSRSAPPDATQPGDLPFLLAGGKPDFNMQVCHWASLGYLSVFVNPHGHVILKKCVEMGNERKKLECKLFEMLFGDDELTDIASLRYKRTAKKAIGATERYWQRRLYSRDSGNVRLMQGLCALASGFATLLTASLLLPSIPVRALALFVCFLIGCLLSVLIQRGPAGWYLGGVAAMTLAVLAAAVQLILARVGGGAGTMVLSVALSVFTGWQTMHGGRRSEFGGQVISQSLGFRRFLSRASQHYLLSVLQRDPQYFYKLLPFAETMGLGAPFAKKFGGAELESCAWYTESKDLPNTAFAFYERWHDTADLMKLAVKK